MTAAPQSIQPTTASERDQIVARLSDLQAKQEAATSWGAAVGAREEEIRSLESRLLRIDAMTAPPSTETPRHTATPWIFDGTSVYYLDWDGVSYEGKGKNYQQQLTNRFWFSLQGSPKRIPKEELEANAAFIVTAVNAIGPSLDALQKICRERGLSEVDGLGYLIAEWVNLHAEGAAGNQPSSSGSDEAFVDLRTHRSSWRRALELSLAMAAPAGVDHDDQAYWRHELAAFDRTFEVLCSGAAQVSSSPVEISQETVGKIVHKLHGERDQAIRESLELEKEVVRLRKELAAAAQAEPERLPTHGNLLAEINKAAHAAGTNAWVRDVLKQAHRAIRLNAPLAAVTPSPGAGEPREKEITRLATIEECADIVEGQIVHHNCREWPAVSSQGNRASDDPIVQHCDKLAAAIRTLALPSTDRGGGK